MMYSQQYGYYTSCWAMSGNAGGDFAIWPTRLRVFLGGDQDLFYCPSQDERCRWRKADTAPGPVAQTLHTWFGYEPGERLLLNNQYFSYGYNGWGTYTNGPSDPYKGLGPHVEAVSPEPLYRELKASRVRLPADMIAVADSKADGWTDLWISPIPTAAGEPPGSVHRGGANVLFCDGHVGWYQQRDLRKPTSFGSAEERLRWFANERLWNYDHSFSLF